MTSLEFADLARRLSAATRRVGFDAPLFRSPPRSPGFDRSLHRRSDGSITVAVRLKQRPALAVAGDMIDGVVAANDLDGRAAGQHRDLLWAEAEELLLQEAEPHARAA